MDWISPMEHIHNIILSLEKKNVDRASLLASRKKSFDRRLSMNFRRAFKKLSGLEIMRDFCVPLVCIIKGRTFLTVQKAVVE